MVEPVGSEKGLKSSFFAIGRAMYVLKAREIWPNTHVWRTLMKSIHPISVVFVLPFYTYSNLNKSWKWGEYLFFFTSSKVQSHSTKAHFHLFYKPLHSKQKLFAFCPFIFTLGFLPSPSKSIPQPVKELANKWNFKRSLVAASLHWIVKPLICSTVDWFSLSKNKVNSWDLNLLGNSIRWMASG